MKSFPHRCEPCVEADSYTGHLVFEGQKPPTCKVHGVPLTPVVQRPVEQDSKRNVA